MNTRTEPHQVGFEGRLKPNLASGAYGPVNNPTEDQPLKRRSRRNRLETAPGKQPVPRIPGITKRMVQQHLPCLSKDKILNHPPATIREWLLAEWHLARELKLSPLRLAYVFSEALSFVAGLKRSHVTRVAATLKIQVHSPIQHHPQQ
jgi:hypothetical protein